MAAITGWAAACVTYVAWVWLSVGRMDAAVTAAHATSEDPARAVTELLAIIAGIASLGAIVVLLIEARTVSGAGRATLAAVAVVSVALSWLLIHTLFTVRYSSLYYRFGGGVDFNQAEPPRYSDFAYLAFTLGMTFQVSDTTITSHEIRVTALGHALLSYLFGSVILATLVNLVAGLS
ncbi:MAG: hypothetical protein JWQ59_1828 [Cryobacterium sp.]|nr:hypothetical protein [Cryobacterium sp.]